MKSIRIIVMFLTYFCLPAIAHSETDAVILSTQTGVKATTRLNLIHTGVTVENGDVWVWGYRNQGLQGNGVSFVHWRSVPARVQKFVDEGLTIMQVAAGRYHIIALDENGDVWGWGRNYNRQATGGVGTDSIFVATPVKVLSGKRVIDIFCNEYTSYALTASGDVWVWGRGNLGETGLNNLQFKQKLQQIPSSFFNDSRVRTMGVGYRSAYAITRSGTIFAWGVTVSNKFCPENQRSCVYSIKPVRINNALVQSNSGISSGQSIKQITGGYGFLTYLTYEGEVFGMGNTLYLPDGKLNENINEEDDDEEWNDNGETEHIENEDEDEKDAEDDRKDPINITESPIPILGKSAASEKAAAHSIYCRYRGCVAITKHKSLLTWGIKGCSRLNEILYGKKLIGSVVQRKLNGILTKFDGGMEFLFYWNEDGDVYGVGNGWYYKLDQSSVLDRDWTAPRVEFLMNAMHDVYGKDHVLGQVQ
ncbi:hypothetical protein J3U08_00730 [Gilliamella sp. B2894]|uniref:RCC1 domain-containing protein n=1 Tax=unclassified Gilliamella TaxID=2685620 RepID=UPI002269F7F3|nr:MULTISPECIES: hypothetical protein [unclassified Gilliamella]MCX8655318.1 hypothetical protein [Gilliamella sp. B2894]MCX8694366.1 hypothetical protein [Gilliamella sp. B2881]MCX8695960.1 hypothetical protein [Gilliamella sp. B2828]